MMLGPLTTGALSAASVFPVPNILRAAEPGKRLRIAQIGCGGRGLGAHIGWILDQGTDDLVAISDPDEKSHGQVKRAMERAKAGASKLEVFTDYRKMFDKIGKSIDVVFIATTNHRELLDSALFRRFHLLLEFRLPDEPLIIETMKGRLLTFDTTKINWAAVAQAALLR